MSRRIIPVAMILAGVAALVLMNQFLFDHFIEDVLFKTVRTPIGLMQRGITNAFGTMDAFLDGYDFAKIEDAKLRLEVQVSQQQSEIEVMSSRIEQLERQLNVEPQPRGSLVLANVISVDRTPISSHIAINRGTDYGVAKGQFVFASGNVLAGMVVTAFDDSAEVQLLDDPRMQFNARITSTGAVSNATGRAGGEIALGFVPQSEEIQIGDRVVTNGLDEAPLGFFIGVVDSIDASNASLFQSVIVKAAFDPRMYPELFVLVP